MKSLGKLRFGLHGALCQFKQSLTTVTAKMMVVFLPGDFIARRVAWDFHAVKPSLLHQSLDIPVNCGNPQRAMMAVSALQGLFGREWPVRLNEGLANSCLLLSVPLLHLLLKLTSQLGLGKHQVLECGSGRLVARSDIQVADNGFMCHTEREGFLMVLRSH